MITALHHFLNGCIQMIDSACTLVHGRKYLHFQLIIFIGIVEVPAQGHYFMESIILRICI